MNDKVLQELIKCVGLQWVLTNPGDLYLYSFDSALDRALPSAVVLPATPDQAASVVGILTRHKVPYVARGAATSLCGGPIPMRNAVVVALTRLNRMGKIESQTQEIWVEPGVVNLRLQQEVAKSGFFYAPDPGSQKACTIGGNVATNAGGPHCLKYGVTSHFVTAAEVILPDGRLTQFRLTDPGYDLLGLLVGSEGTLGIVTRVKLKLLAAPKFIRTMLASFSSIEDAIQAVTDIIAAGLLPATLEAMDRTIVAAVEAFVHAGYPTDAEAVLLIEVDGDDAARLENESQEIQTICVKNHSGNFRFAQDEAERMKLWEGRRGAYAAMARLAPNVLVEDGAVPRTKLPEALRRIKQIAEESDLRVAFLLHAGDGNLHPQIIFDERDVKQTQIVKEAGSKMLKVCVDLGGTISGEHGIGLDKREAMKWLFTRETLNFFRRLKNVFDPHNLCNPDKLIPLTSNATEEGDVPPEASFEFEADGSITPSSEDEMVRIVQSFARHRTSFGVQGSGSKYQVKESALLRTTKLNRILDFDKANLTLVVQAGANLADVRTAVEKEGRYLWVAGPGTVGGVIASRASIAPPLRNLILGMRVLLPTGEVIQLGAKTMKNVAGYDAAKLLVGSWGTLGIILDVTFRLFATPATLMTAETVQPFVFGEFQTRIKAAFDPNNILAIRMTFLTKERIAVESKGHSKVISMGNMGSTGKDDKFWV